MPGTLADMSGSSADMSGTFADMSGTLADMSGTFADMKDAGYKPEFCAAKLHSQTAQRFETSSGE
ncbi:MAG: hypothetical protein LBL31_01570 [Spirochaetaceae bacterium]|jgi:hypothetical protein|nr:hypothetical protein [Spirochaetaceae bacterium]